MKEHCLGADPPTDLYSRHHVGHAHVVLGPLILEMHYAHSTRKATGKQNWVGTAWERPAGTLTRQLCGLRASRPERRRTKAPSCDSQQRMVAATTACAQWGAADERPQGLHPTPGYPEGGAWSALLNFHRPFRGFVSFFYQVVALSVI